MRKTISVVLLACLLMMGMVGTAGATGNTVPDNEQDCIAADGTWTPAVYENVLVKEGYTETVEEAYVQRYSWKGGPFDGEEGVTPPPVIPPHEDWQANTKSDPHGIGEAGPYYRSAGASGEADWFYLEYVDAVTIDHPDVYEDKLVKDGFCTLPTVEDDPDCSLNERAGGQSIADYLTENELNCIDVDVVEACGELTGTLTVDPKVPNAGAYTLKWVEDSEVNAGNIGDAVALPAAFGEDTGDHTVTVYVDGPEQDYVLASDDAGFAFLNGGETYTVDTDCEANIPPQPEDDVVTTEWVDGDWECDDTTVEQTRTVTTTPYVYDEQSNTWVEGTESSVEETRTRDLDPDDEQFDCPIDQSTDAVLDTTVTYEVVCVDDDTRRVTITLDNDGTEATDFDGDDIDGSADAIFEIGRYTESGATGDDITFEFVTVEPGDTEIYTFDVDGAEFFVVNVYDTPAIAEVAVDSDDCAPDEPVIRTPDDDGEEIVTIVDTPDREVREVAKAGTLAYTGTNVPTLLGLALLLMGAGMLALRRTRSA